LNTDPPARSRAPRRRLAAALLAVGLALNGHTLCSFFRAGSDLNARPAIAALTDPRELAARQAAVVGTYLTGDQTGDRSITVQPDGHVIFAEIGSSNPVLNNRDTYRLGRRGQQLCLVTAGSGVIDLVDHDNFLYFGDNYRRR
jgi:hypothetical protein